MNSSSNSNIGSASSSTAGFGRGNNRFGAEISPIYGAHTGGSTGPSGHITNSHASSTGALTSSNAAAADSSEMMPLFNTANAYNQVGFSPTILSVLVSFEELQHQLRELMSPASIALTLLLQRLVGVSGDLLYLAERNHHSSQYDESDRLLALRSVIENTIDADLTDSAQELVCGRGRRRLDNLQVLIQQVQVGCRELQRLAIRSRAESEYTGAQALDEVAADLSKSLGRVEQVLSGSAFSLLDGENGNSNGHHDSGGGLEITELIAREGTSLISSDFLFQFCSGREGHSIGSLAIVAGAGAVLRHIRAFWPNLTALSAPLSGQPQLPAHGDEQHWGDMSYEIEAKFSATAAGNAFAQSPLQDSSTR